VGENELTFLVFLIFDVNLNFVADGEFGVVAELADGDDAVALVANVDDNLALVDADDGAFHDIVVVDTREALLVSLFLLCQTLFGLSGAFLVAFPIEVFEGLDVC